MLGQEAVEDKSNETTAIPVLLERLAAGGGLKGAIVTIDAIACNGTIAKAVRDAGADYLLAVKANQPTLRHDIETFFDDAPEASLERCADVDKGHGRIEQRAVTVAREVDWLTGERRFPGELRLPDVAAIVRVESKTELKDRCRFETPLLHLLGEARPRPLLPPSAAIGASKTAALDARRRLRGRPIALAQGHGAKNMAVVRHFAINLVRQADEAERPRTGLRRKTAKPKAPTKTSIRMRRKLAGWDLDFLQAVLAVKVR